MARKRPPKEEGEECPLSERLRMMRRECGFTQKQLALFLSMDRSTYSYYETDRSTPPLPVLLLMMRLYRIPFEALLPGEEGLKAFYRLFQSKAPGESRR